ncbi:MAG: class I SAM-dependent methyltransferase [Aquitalea sp.]|nr:class I SAM-dependent methyltransferase [Aquitalea sp.]
MTNSILIFPAGMPRALTYLERAQSDGMRIIGSSSLKSDTARGKYSEWVYLPYVTSPDFNDALSRAIEDFDIEGIFTPNPVVWDYLNRCMAVNFPGVKLVNTSPIASEVAPYHKAMQFAESVLVDSLPLATAVTPQPAMSKLQTASLFCHSESIPGMCDHEKIRALCELFRYAPCGDIVEIGSWWGKSAFVLSRLAMYYGVGKLLCVDPWSNEQLIQNDEKGLVDRVPVDAEEALTIFQLNLLPYAHGAINFLRLPSIAAEEIYRTNPNISSHEFGETTFAGGISILHIDGNHSYRSARADIDAWAKHILPGGWIVFDDYIWPYGNGPQKAGDEFMMENLESIELAFVMGSALFIKKYKNQ